jgi:hypothetical protein
MSLASRRWVIRSRRTRCGNHSVGYIKWFYRVSHTLVIAPATVPDYTTPVPPYEDVIVEQQWVRQPPDSFQIIWNIRAMVDSAAGVHDVYSNPTVVGIMESIQAEYSMLEVVAASQRRRIRVLSFDFCIFVVFL